MSRVIGFLLLAVLVIACAWWVAGLPGEVAAQVAGTTIQTSVPVALLLLAVLFLVLLFLLWVILSLIRLPGRLRARRAARRRRQGDAAVTRTLIALAAGEPGDARREAIRARKLLGDTPHTLLLTAESARRAGRAGEAEANYRLLSERKDAAFLGLRGLLRQAIAREDWPAAAELAAQAEASHPGSGWLRAERAQLAMRAGNWREALTLTPPDRTQAALAAAASEAEGDPPTALKLAKQAFNADPSLPAAALAYARRLRETGRETRAQDVLRRAWAARPHPDLAALALANTIELARVKAAEALTRDRPNDPETHLLLAQASLSAGLTGEARRHAEAAREGGLNQRRVWTLLADTAEAEGNPEAASDALRHLATSDPDPVWRCENCGAAQAAWQPICPACHAAGRIAWGSEPRTLVIHPAS